MIVLVIERDRTENGIMFLVLEREGRAWCDRREGLIRNIRIGRKN